VGNADFPLQDDLADFFGGRRVLAPSSRRRAASSCAQYPVPLGHRHRQHV